MERTWTKTGEKFYAAGSDATDEAGRRFTRERVEAAIDQLDWVDATGEHPAMPALAIKILVKQARIPRVSLIGYGPALAPYSLLGIEGRFTNGRARVYAVDCGSDAIILASDFWPDEQTAEEAN